VAVIRATDRQQQILELAAQGRSDKEVATALGISVHTVRSHLQRLYRAQGFTNRVEAVAAWAAQLATDGAEPPVLGPEVIGEQEERLSKVAEITAATRVPIQTSFAQAQLVLVNGERAASGLTALEWDESVATVAADSARQMAETGHLDTVITSRDADGRKLMPKTSATGPASTTCSCTLCSSPTPSNAATCWDPTARSGRRGPTRALESRS